MVVKIIFLFWVAALTGCASFVDKAEIAKLQSEIADLNTSIANHQQTIEANTSELSRSQHDIVTTLNYSTLRQLTSAFSALPKIGRTMTFRQTKASGYLHEVSTRCRLDYQRGGQKIRFNSDTSTSIDLELLRMDIRGLSDGFELYIPGDLNLETRVKGATRPPCAGGWSSWVRLRGYGEADPKFRFRAEFAPPRDNAIGYKLILDATEDMDIEMRAPFAFLNFRTTINIEGSISELGEGSIQLPTINRFSVSLLDGTTRDFEARLEQHELGLGTQGVTLSAEAAFSGATDQ